MHPDDGTAGQALVVIITMMAIIVIAGLVLAAFVAHVHG